MTNNGNMVLQKSANRNRQYRKQGRFLQRGLVCTAYPPSNLRLALQQQYWTDIRSPAQPSGFCGCFDNIFTLSGGPERLPTGSITHSGHGKAENLSALAETFLFFHYLLVDSLGSPGQAAFLKAKPVKALLVGFRGFDYLYCCRYWRDRPCSGVAKNTVPRPLPRTRCIFFDRYSFDSSGACRPGLRILRQFCGSRRNPAHNFTFIQVGRNRGPLL